LLGHHASTVQIDEGNYSMNKDATYSPVEMDEDDIHFGALLDTIYLDRHLVAAIAVIIAMLGFGYAFFATPIYEADFSIQIEDSPNSTNNILGDMASMFNTKTAATAEIEILRSRMVVSRAVDNLALNVSARPKRLPILGAWMASLSNSLSDPIFGGYVSGSEAISVAAFNVPEPLDGQQFTVMANGNGGFELLQTNHDLALKGETGKLMKFDTAQGKIELLVTQLEANAGAEFVLQHHSRLKSIESLQSALKIEEKGKQSGVIRVKLEGADPDLTSRILNEVGQEYIRQNVERKSAEAEKSLTFLSKQLPELKRNLEAAENKYNNFRDTRGTIDIGEEGKDLLQQSVAVEEKLIAIKQEREEKLMRFTSQHPSVMNTDSQILILENQQSSLQTKIKNLPALEQEVLRLVRDVNVNTELYTSLLNTSQQLNLVKASKVGNARMIDVAVTPETPIKPRRFLICVLSIIIGLFSGVITAFIRKAMHGGIDHPNMIEAATGLPVYATILESKRQEQLAEKIVTRESGKFILAETDPDDLAIESLRSFRIALQFAMMDAANNRVMITGPTPKVGKTFVSANLAIILGQAGKRVLLMDMDLHQGHLNNYFGIGRKDGLSDLLAGEKTLEQIIHKDISQNVDLLPVGTRVPNPGTLLLNPLLPKIFDQASRQYDIVLVDASPALLVSDVAVIGAHMGTTFLVVRDGLSTIADLNVSIKHLEHAHVKVKGVLFNGQLQRLSSSHGYGYGYKYGSYKQDAE